MSHVFLEINDNVVNSTTISEGWAEYYSTRILWTEGFIDDDEYMELLNNNIRTYFTNPAVNFTNADVHAHAWEASYIQKIPYGRGLVYLANLDVQMRTKYRGKKSVDTLTLVMIERRQQGLSHSLEDWFNILRDYLGERAVDEYKRVASGTSLLEPLPGVFSPCFKVVEESSSPTVYRLSLAKGRNAMTCII